MVLGAEAGTLEFPVLESDFTTEFRLIAPSTWSYASCLAFYTVACFNRRAEECPSLPL